MDLLSTIFSADTMFYVFSAVALGSAVGVVLQRNPVSSLLFMVATLASLAGIFVLFEAHFLAAIQVMVYAGAIMVLFLFVIMLLNLGHDEEGQPTLERGLIQRFAWRVLAFAVVGASVGLVVAATRGAAPDAVQPLAAAELDALVAEKGAVGAIADPLFTTHVVAFELTGILLLIAVVGAIALAKRRT